ncbi:flagellar basal body rod protein FlgC [Humisphaera borealis]|uniref:Flagellar biosynthesis protein FlgG n=1 Tax=Humisphaera borealis TaxID=2807512 RepID=A0A7M2X4G9_9BACT|nr:flagellar basal body rod C-terminal domain-containing protein [Humisphaera borealis]QOV92519.1 flagellar biosynthesis protein FlgG [Humisphaera borealis]
MFSVLDIAASGLSAASARIAVTAGNIANLNTSGYQARRANLTPVEPAGVRVDSVTLDETPAGIDEEGLETSNVDLVGETVNLIRDKHLYQANAKLLKTGDQMLGTLLDVLAR